MTQETPRLNIKAHFQNVHSAHLCGSKPNLGLMEKNHPPIAMVFMGDSYLAVHPRNRKWIITPVISVNLAPTKAQ